MWVDNASVIDMLFYKPYSDVIQKILSNEKMTPVTIGLFGPWGAGKSTLLNFIGSSIDDMPSSDGYRCIKINAWMLEGYDDAKSAIIEALLTEIQDSIEKGKTFSEKAREHIKNILAKVNWLKLGGYLVKKGVATAVSLSTMNPLPIMMSFAADAQDVASTVNGIQSVQDEFIKQQSDKQVTRTIREIKEEFEELLAVSDIKNLVVIIDDLDRCMPRRIVETLEAVKLFLSVKKSTFIFAVDESIVRYAIRQQYPAIEPNFDIAKDYIEKIIQIPITLPELSSKDIENYLLLLVLEEYLPQEALPIVLEEIRKSKLLTASISIAKIQITEILREKKIVIPYNDEFIMELGIIDEIRVVVSSSLKGNPRQAKRFLNAFSIKKELAKLYFGTEIDLRYLAKLLALYLINSELFKVLQGWANGYIGDIEELHDLVRKVDLNEDITESGWGDKKIIKWLRSEPKDIYKYNLSQYFYLTRDITAESDDQESQLNAYEKKAMSEIINYPTVRVDLVFKALKTNKNVNMDILATALITNFEKGTLKLDRLCYLVDNFPKYTILVIKSISSKVSDVKPSDLPSLKKLYALNAKEFGVIMTKLPSRLQQLVTGDK